MMCNKPKQADYQLARLSFSDLRAIYKLEQAIFPLDAYPYLDLALLLLTPRMVNIKAEKDQQILGFIAVADVWLRFNPAWIITLGVGLANQNQGIGRHLLTEIESRLHSSCIRLTVRRGNSAAIHLYHSSGYELYHTRPRYYSDGEDGLVMQKQL